MNQEKRKNWFLTFLLLPSLFLFIIFTAYPTIRIFLTSLFLDTGIGGEAKFVGIKNYIKMFHDPVFYTALKNTLFLVIVVAPISLLLALFFAAVLTTGKFKERNFYRTVLFFPSILSLVSVGILWSFIFNPTMGILTAIFGPNAPAVLGSKKTVMWAIAIVMIWQAAGYYMVMYIASIDNISKDVYEAADLDGANGWQKFWNITVQRLSM